MKKAILFFLLIIGSLNVVAQNSNKDPLIVVNDFLNLSKVSDLPEAKEKLNNLLFESIRIPSVNKFEILYSDYFKTDVDGIAGYKSVVLIDNGSVEKKYLLVAYKDSNKGWNIFSFREYLDVQKEVNAFNKPEYLNDIEYTKLQYNYRNYSYWLIMNGELLKAKEMIGNAFEIAKKDNDSKFESNYISMIDSLLNK